MSQRRIAAETRSQQSPPFRRCDTYRSGRLQRNTIHHNDRKTASEAAAHPRLSRRRCDTYRSGQVIAAASGAVSSETPLLTVNLWQIPSPGCWAWFQGLSGRLGNTGNLWQKLHNLIKN